MSNSTFSQIAKYQSAYMYNFFSFLEWPASSRSGDFNIGVLGNDDIIPELQAIAKTKKVITQPIKVLVFNSVDDITNCQVLFIPKKQSSNMQKAIEKIGSNNTLIISNTPNGISKGAAINFVLKGGKLAFELKKSNAEKYNIKISSNLNQLATKVY
jgi:hypothetical protein